MRSEDAERDRPNPYDAPSRGERPIVPTEGFRDRRTALTAFGVLEILLGILFFGFALLIPVSQLFASRTLGQEIRIAKVVPSMLVYVLLAGTMIALGVGSMRARRWARNLMLVVGWAWLISGVLTVAGLSFILPSFLSQLGQTEDLPEDGVAIILGLVLAILVFFMVLIPGVLVFFYRSRNVRATCEFADPEPDWTEACPLPVLTISLWIFVSALFLFVTPLAVNGTMPFFGTFASGLAGTLLYWVVAGLWGYGAWGLYKLRLSSWWIVFGSTVVLAMSYLTTFVRQDPMAMYERMGYSASELLAMKQFGFFTGPQLVAWILVFFVPYLGYLVYLKKYLPSQ